MSPAKGPAARERRAEVRRQAAGANTRRQPRSGRRPRVGDAALALFEPPEEVYDYTLGGNTWRPLRVAPPTTRAPHVPWRERGVLYEAQDVMGPSVAKFWVHGETVRREVISDAGLALTEVVVVPRFERTERWPKLFGVTKNSLGVRRGIAALWYYQVLTAGQLGAFMGLRENHRHRVLRALFQCGFVERGRLDAKRSNARVEYLYRLHLGEPLFRWLDGLDATERFGVTSNLGPSGHNYQNTSHDLLAAELALRIQEMHDNVAFVAGPGMASASMLFHSPAYPFASALPRGGPRGDLLVVLRNGLRIVFEMTRTQRPEEIRSKMEAWGRILAQGDLADLGTVVVFMNIAPPTDPRGWNKRITALLKAYDGALSPTGLGTPGQPASRAQVRRATDAMFLVAWKDWFPFVGDASEDFLDLSVCRPQGGYWGRISLNPHGTGPTVQFDQRLSRISVDRLRATKPPASDVYARPAWLREPRRPRALDAAGPPPYIPFAS